MTKNQHKMQLVCTGATLIEEYLAALKTCWGPQNICLAHSAGEARREFPDAEPTVILFDQSAIESSANLSLESAVAMLTDGAPIVVVATQEFRSGLAFLIALGAIDFVVRAGNFVTVAADLVKHRIRMAESASGDLGPEAEDWGDNFGEILRHEVNNPLTGILGNAELLLAQRHRLPPADIARVKTIAELAVRLRDTVRRLSSAYSLRNG